MRPVSQDLLFQERLSLADIERHAAQDSLKTVERPADGEAALDDTAYADGGFMRAGALLDDGNRAPHGAERFEIAQQDYGVGEIGYIDGCFHVADQTVL